MRIAQLTTHIAAGGAARAARRLHDGLLEAGETSIVYATDANPKDEKAVTFKPSATFGARSQRRCRDGLLRWRRYASGKAGNATSELFSDSRTRFGPEPLIGLPTADIYNLHWINGFVDVPLSIPTIAATAPMVWTMHDMNTFTGGCHYDGGCGRFTIACGNCPQLTARSEHDLSNTIHREKRRTLGLISPERIVFVANSRWTAAEASRSSLLAGFRVETIHYGLNTAVFLPRDKEACRAALGIPPGAQVVLFVADYVSNKRKGASHLSAALRLLVNDVANLFVLSIGNGDVDLFEGIAGLHLGPISNDALLVTAYNSADVFVIPSTQEAFGLTALEAMACGVAPVGFRVGGIVDMIEDGITGLLAESADSHQLASLIRTLLLDEALRRQIGFACRQAVISRFSLDRQAAEYISLYSELAATVPKGL